MIGDDWAQTIRDNPADLEKGMWTEDFLGQNPWNQSPERLEGDSSHWPATSIPIIPTRAEEEYGESTEPKDPAIPFHTMIAPDSECLRPRDDSIPSS